VTAEEWKVVRAQEKADGKGHYAGSPQPVDGKCAAKLANSIDKYQEQRYCCRPQGDRTPHGGTGSCFRHGGNTTNHLKKAARDAATTELRSMAEQLGQPDPIGPYAVEAELLVRKVKQWAVIYEGKMAELKEISDWDRQGVEHVRVAVDILERGWDRLQKVLEFAMKHDLEKKRLELEEYQGILLANAIMSVFRNPQLRLTDDQMEMAETQMRSALIPIAPSLEPRWKQDLEAIEVKATAR
jgi:hypothetical protein